MYRQTLTGSLHGESQAPQTPCKMDRDDCEPFIQWICERIRKECWSIFASCLRAKEVQEVESQEQFVLAIFM